MVDSIAREVLNIPLEQGILLAGEVEACNVLDAVLLISDG